MYENNSVHRDSFQIGMEFQDFVAEKLIKELGIPITLYGSKKNQFSMGENIQGVEIKYDARSTGDCTYYNNAATNTIAIEIAEKTKRENFKWVDSGIYRNDNSWLYIVGNYMQFWIFGKSTLRIMHQSGNFKVATTLPTVMNMLISIEDADTYCLKKITNGPNR